MYVDEDLTPEDLAQMRRKEEIEAGRFDKVDAAAQVFPSDDYFDDD